MFFHADQMSRFADSQPGSCGQAVSLRPAIRAGSLLKAPRGIARVRIALTGLLLVLGSSHAPWGQPSLIRAAEQSWEGSGDEERFLSGLRQRRLFELAEQFCESELARAGIKAERRNLLVMELVRTHGEHALQSLGATRERELAKAKETVADYIRAHSDDPRLMLIRAQEALAVMSMAELQREESEMGAAGADVAQARATLREATRLLESLEKEVGAATVARQRKTGKGAYTAKDEGLSLAELSSLQNNVRRQIARVYRNQGLTYEQGSNDRIASLSQALEQLRSIATQLAQDEPLLVRIRLDEAACLRWAEKYDDAAALLRDLQGSNGQAFSSELRSLYRAEQIRLELSRGRLQEAASLAGDLQAASRTAELDFAMLETLVALGKAAEKAGKIDQAKKWQNECAAVLPQLEQRYGVYWRHRGELLVVRSASSGTTRTSLDLLARTADDLYLRKEYAEAVAAYDKAAEMAESLSEAKRQFELLYRGALILQEQKQHAEAAKRFRALSTSLAEDSRSDQAQLLAAWNAAQAARQVPETMRQYVEILEEHLRLWPASDSANQVRQWLAQVHESRREWEQAIALYQRVDAGSPQYGSVLTAMCNDWMRLVTEASEGKSQGDLADRARESLDEILATVSSEEATKWQQPLQQVSMTLARLHLQYGGKPERAQQILESLRRSFEEGGEGESAAIRAEAEALLVVAMASQPAKQAEAQALVQQLAAASPASLMEMIEGLARIEARSKGGTNKALAELALQAVRTLETRRSSLSATQQLRLDTIAASALATTGQRAEAVSRYAKLAQANPNDGAIQEGYARLLLEGEDRASWQAALDQWRRISSKSPPQTERWYRAKYSVALAQYRLGQKEQAAQLIRFMIETPPGLANCPIEREFQELLAKCQRP